MKIAIIDYDIGNVRSIVSAFENQGAQVILTRDKDIILSADGVVLPGVGAFSHGMKNLNEYNLVEIIREYIRTNKPFMGICLGMQMLFDKSEEFGETVGLGVVSGKVEKLPVKKSQKEKLPHVSWNEINDTVNKWSGTILEHIENNSDVYFVHSFVVIPKNKEEILSITEYCGYNFCSSIRVNNVYGCQFHPEKSGKVGLKIINNFIRICQK